MQFGINLLPGARKPPLVGKGILWRIKLLIALLLVTYTIFIGVLVVFSFYLSSSARKLQDQTSTIEAKIRSFQKRESLEITLKERIGEARKIFELRERASQAQTSSEQVLSRAQSLLLPGVSLGTIEVSPGEFALSGEASNFQVLGDFLDQFTQSVSGWSWVSLDSLARTANGLYSFSLKAQL